MAVGTIQLPNRLFLAVPSGAPVQHDFSWWADVARTSPNRSGPRRAAWLLHFAVRSAIAGDVDRSVIDGDAARRP